MELIAVLKALLKVRKIKNISGIKITVLSDSTYVVNSINNGLLYKWGLNGWKTTTGSDVSNQDIWKKIYVLVDELKPVFKKVKGHSGNKFNDFVDRVAVEECTKIKKHLEATRHIK